MPRYLPLLTLVVLVSLVSRGPAAAAAGPDTEPARVPAHGDADWLAEVPDYEIVGRRSFVTAGVALEFSFASRATRDGHARTSVTAMGQTRTVISTPDSVWYVMESIGTWTVTPWVGRAEASADPTGAMERLMQPPWPYPFAAELANPESGLRFEADGSDTLTVNGEPRPCTTWRCIAADTADVGRIWYDPGTGAVLRMVSETETPLPFTYTAEISVLRAGAGTTAGDLAFVPDGRLRRVDAPGKLMVRNPLEGTRPADLELRDLTGLSVATSAWRGRPVLVDFWATWCAPCVKALPHLQQLHREMGDRLQVVGIGSEAAAKVQAFAERHGVTYPLLVDDGSAAEAYRVEGLPAIFLLDAEGVVREQFAGYQDYETIRQAVDRLLEASGR
jgi:peroxiredoxin